MTGCKGYERRREECVLRQHSRMCLWGVRETKHFSAKNIRPLSRKWKVSPRECSPLRWVFQLLPCLDLPNLIQHYVITSQLAPGQQTGPPVPYKEVWVESGKRFRLRLLGGLCTVCGIQFSIEGHDLTVIATDGGPIKPVIVTSVIIYSGINSYYLKSGGTSVNRGHADLYRCAKKLSAFSFSFIRLQ